MDVDRRLIEVRMAGGEADAHFVDQLVQPVRMRWMLLTALLSHQRSLTQSSQNMLHLTMARLMLMLQSLVLGTECLETVLLSPSLWIFSTTTHRLEMQRHRNC